jgi:hypothetical protein
VQPFWFILVGAETIGALLVMVQMNCFVNFGRRIAEVTAEDSDEQRSSGAMLHARTECNPRALERSQRVGGPWAMTHVTRILRHFILCTSQNNQFACILATKINILCALLAYQDNR